MIINAYPMTIFMIRIRDEFDKIPGWITDYMTELGLSKRVSYYNFLNCML